MLVVHPQDRTTDVLKLLYEGLEAKVITKECSNRMMGQFLHSTSIRDRIMLLGNGSERGLYYRKNDEEEGFDGIIVGHPQAYQLRRHGSNMIGIWCHAVEFAKAEGLHGLFSGMIISEMSEAEEYGIATTLDEIRSSNRTMFCHLRKLIDEETPWHEIPARMKEMDNEHTPLSEFNYNNFYNL